MKPLIDRVQAFLDRVNPCQVRILPITGANLPPGSTMAVCRGGTPCCGGCKFLGPKGCTTPNLACKLYLCYAARESLSQSDMAEFNKLIEESHSMELRFRGDGSKVIMRPGGTFDYAV